MKQAIRLTVISFVAIFCLYFLTAPANAQVSEFPTSEQLRKITDRCSEIKISLKRVHADDALLRVNQGQTYGIVSGKLMARLNSRAALNSLDTSTLVAATNLFKNDVETFRTSYQDYENSLSNLIGIDCASEPELFYQELSSTRQKRILVFDATDQVSSDVSEYKKAFDEFRQKTQEGSK